VEEVTIPEKTENTKKNSEKYISATEIAIKDARKIKPDCQLGDIVTVEVKSEEFSRRAAKNAKGTIVQKIREEEKSAIYNEYHAKEKEIITGIVQRIDEKGNVLVDIGRTQTTLKVSDQVKGETFERGDRIKLYVVSVSNKEKPGTLVKVSRTSPMLVERLFEEEVTEIKDGIVEIMGIAREAGSRTKMAVRAKLPNVDPVGACVGVNGARVKAIVNELGNEQIDIIEWDENPAQLIVNALSPAKVVSATADDEEKKAQIVVSDQQLSLAIGKSGQNVRLAAKLTGFGIDIKSEAQVNEASGEVENIDEEEELSFTEDNAMEETSEIEE
jgi:N utilization substance protein A